MPFALFVKEKFFEADMLSLAAASREVRIDLSELDVLGALLASLDRLEGLHLALVVGESPLVIALAANAGKDACALDALGESAEKAERILRSISRYFYVGCHSK